VKLPGRFRGCASSPGMTSAAWGADTSSPVTPCLTRGWALSSGGSHKISQAPCQARGDEVYGRPSWRRYPNGSFRLRSCGKRCFLDLSCAVTAGPRPGYPTRCAAAKVRCMACHDHPLCRASSLPMGHPDLGTVFAFLDSVSCVSNSREAERWRGTRRVALRGKTAMRAASLAVWSVIPCGSFRCARSRNAGPLNMSLVRKSVGDSAIGVRPHGQED